MIKIFSLPSHQKEDRTSGVDFARIIQPAKHLGKQKGFEVHLYDIHKDKTLAWDKVAEENDIIWLNYMAMPWEFAKMGVMVRKHGKKLVLDLDDSLWHINPDNPAFKAYAPGGEQIKNFTAICNEVDYITTTNKYLRNLISHNTNKPVSKIEVLPNYIDLDNIYTHRSELKDDHQIRLLHFGSTTHFTDLQEDAFMEGVDRILKDYPNVTLKTVGALIPQYKHKWGRRYENGFGHQDIYKWVDERFPMFMNETDILVTPLSDNRYNRCKSSIKFLEGSSAKKPGVWQRMRQYEEVVQHGVNGFLASSADDWYNSIKKLIDDKELRKSVGESAFKTVEDSWQLKNNIDKYCNFFENIR